MDESGLGPFEYRYQKIDKKEGKKCFSKGEKISLPEKGSPSTSRVHLSVFGKNNYEKRCKVGIFRFTFIRIDQIFGLRKGKNPHVSIINHLFFPQKDHYPSLHPLPCPYILLCQTS